VEGYTENITIQSIVGRYLEHSRIYIFGTPDRDKIYISSADFMTRNSLRRVEVAAPIYQEDIRKRLRHMFQIMMEDNVKARVMDKNGIYHKKELTNPPQNSQEYFFKESAGSK
jgi:polyphosphate kinase